MTDPEPTATDLPEAVPGLDVAGALGMVRGKQDLLLRLLSDFRARYMDTPEKVRAMVARGEVEDACRAAHSLKGVSGNIGAGRTYAAAKALEDALRDGADAGGKPDIAPLLRELDDALAELGGGLRTLLEPDA